MSLEAPRAGSIRGVGVDLPVEKETRRSRIIKATDDVGMGWVGSGARDLSEQPMVVGGSVPDVRTMREGVSREGRRKMSKGDMGVSRSEDAQPRLAVEFPLSRVSPHSAVTSVRGKISEGSFGPIGEVGTAESAQVRFFFPREGLGEDNDLATAAQDQLIPRDSVYDQVLEGADSVGGDVVGVRRG